MIETVPLIRLQGVSKSFGEVRANHDISLEIEEGKILALLGENGAGKSTLMNILCGLYRQDAGDVYVRGVKADIRSPRDATDLGIGMVHQNSCL